MPKPIKRAQALQPISREHHHGLLVCWKIREGMRLKIDPIRIKRYTDWFWNNSLQNHFEMEEKHIFPILGNDNDLIKKALLDHHELQQLFTSNSDAEQNLLLIEQKLTNHIRFEERILFNEIQKVATKEQLVQLEKTNKEVLTEDWADEFWV